MSKIDNIDLKVSIIMPVYQAGRTIEKAVSSVIAQSYEHWELILIDDFCPDNSCKQIESLIANDSRIIQIKNIYNEGVAASRNKGIEQAKGEVIAFLDSDDYWHENKLSLQLDRINEGYDVVCSNYLRVSSDKILVKVRCSEIFDYSDMLKSNKIGNLTGVYRCDHIGKIYQKNIGHEDYLMWLEIVKATHEVYCVQQPLAYYQVSNNSLSANKLQAMIWQWNIYRQELGFSKMKSMWLFICYIYLSFKKRH